MRSLFLTAAFALLYATSFSQFTKPLAVLQGIDMPIRSGYGTEWSAYYLQDGKGYIAQNITFPSTGGTTYRIDVSGYSSEYQNNTWANMQIKIDGVLKKEIIVSSTKSKFYSFLISGISAGTHQVQIASTKRVGPSTAGRLFIGMVYITQTTEPKPYVYPAIVKQPFKLGQRLNALHFGSQVLRGFSLGGAYLTMPDLVAMKSTGANIGRYFIKVERITGTNKYQFRAGEKAKSDSLVARASRLGFYVIPTLQIYPEDVNEDFWGKDATGAERRANIIAFWKTLAIQYKDNPWVAAYDPINEPRNNRRYADWIRFLSKIIEGIRSVDPTRCILVEHSFNVEMFGMAQPLPYSNLVYSPHGYPPLKITHQGVTATGGTNYKRVAYPVTTATDYIGVFTKTELAAALNRIRDFAHTYNVPVFVGEFSCASWALNGTSTQWIADNIAIIEAEKWSWGYHSFRESPAWDAELPYSLYKNATFNSNGTPVISRSEYIAARTMSAPTMVMLKKYFALNTPAPEVRITSPSATTSFMAPASVRIIAAVTGQEGTIKKVEFYNGSTLLRTEGYAPYDWTWSNVPAGTYKITAKAYDNNGKVTTSMPVSITVGSTTYAVPGKVEAENYYRMSGVVKQTTTDVNGGQSVGYIDQGDWMDYSVKTTASGTFNVTFRLASTTTTGSQFQVRNSSGTVLATVAVPYTGGWQVWKSVTVPVKLVSGTQTLRLYSSKAARWNINYMSFAASSSSTTSTAASQNSEIMPVTMTAAMDSSAIMLEKEKNIKPFDFVLVPNPAVNKVQVALDDVPTNEKATIIVQSMSGAVVKRIPAVLSAGGNISIDLASLSTGTYLIRITSNSYAITKKLIKTR